MDVADWSEGISKEIHVGRIPLIIKIHLTSWLDWFVCDYFDHTSCGIKMMSEFRRTVNEIIGLEIRDGIHTHTIS